MPSSPLYPYTLLRSKRKTLALQITREGEIVVRSPLKLPEEEIRRFVAESPPGFRSIWSKFLPGTVRPCRPSPRKSGFGWETWLCRRFPGG